ncbi:MAG: TCP-1/cpn60 chaperonin family protein [Methanobacteriaceae archaeon]|nr:TCP-1/cpn60 chaperonin family protein [Methanobacteriaceae archaeon]
MANENQPIFILRDDTERYQGSRATRMNIMAGKILAETIRTTLGPKGMDKMLVDGMGDIVVSNDGATILQEMDIAHPAAKMLVEVAKKQDNVVGDGTTTVVVLAGELLKKAEELFENGVHASTVLKGYRLALDKVMEILFTISIDAKDQDTLEKIAITAMTGKGADVAADKLAELIVEAALRVENKGKIDKKDINIQRVNGGSVEESEIVDGIIIDKGRPTTAMPQEINEAKIALMKYPIEHKDTNANAKVDFTNPSQMQLFLDREEQELKDMVAQIVDSGANVLFCQKGIDDVAMHYLAKQGVYALKRVKKSDMNRIAKATGAQLVTDINDLTPDKLGIAGHIFEQKIFDQKFTFVEGCEDPKACSIIVRGSTRHISSEVERALEDALGVVSATIEDGKIVIGGGSPEVEMAKQLKAYSETIDGREQLSIKAFAEALEVIPRTLAENAGLDAIDILVDLRSAHETNPYMGINVFTGEIVDMKEAGVIEPQRVKKQAIQSATEACEMILRIDDLVAAQGALNKPDAPEGMDDPGNLPPMPPQGMGGMGGMPPMM